MKKYIIFSILTLGLNAAALAQSEDLPHARAARRGTASAAKPEKFGRIVARAGAKKNFSAASTASSAVSEAAFTANEYKTAAKAEVSSQVRMTSNLYEQLKQSMPNTIYINDINEAISALEDPNIDDDTVAFYRERWHVIKDKITANSKLNDPSV